MNILDKEDLAAYLKVDMKTVKCLLYRKKIPKVKIGKEYRFLQSDIDEWIVSNRQKPQEMKFSFEGVHR